MVASDREASWLGRVEAVVQDGEATLPELIALWKAHEPSRWREAPQLCRDLTRRFLNQGHPLVAHEVLAEVLEGWGEADPYLEHLYGLVLARSGATERAARLARNLRHRAGGDPVLYADVMGLLARSEKDLALQASTSWERRPHLRRALGIYGAAYRRTRQSYAAINAATMAFLLDRSDEARRLATQARTSALAELRGRTEAGEPIYWQEATVGEAALILEDHGEAERRYASAAAGAAGELTALSAMGRQARLILSHRREPSDWLDAVFAVPRTAVFVGQMCDPADREEPRFSASDEALVRTRIGRRLDALDVGFGFASASAGSEILFLEAVLERGGQTWAVLPCPREQFERERVRPSAGEDWMGRFDRVLERSVEVIEASGSMGGTVATQYSELFLIGLAAMQSQVLDTELVRLAVWDGVESEQPPGSTLRLWRAYGHDVEIIGPADGMGNQDE